MIIKKYIQATRGPGKDGPRQPTTTTNNNNNSNNNNNANTNSNSNRSSSIQLDAQGRFAKINGDLMEAK